MKAYLALGQRILDEGVWVTNPRTGVRCLTLINADLVYDVAAGEVPVVTTRRVPYKGGLAESVGYLRGFSSAADFRAIGSNTWNANANENAAWLKNPNRQGIDDMGRVYGVQGRDWINARGEHFDQLKKVIDNLSRGIDDRGEIITFWNPGEFAEGCLRPCMHTHQFSLLDGVLYLNSFQRSIDWALGLTANMVQCYFFLTLMARITGHKPGKVYHKLVNCHIYENQLELAKLQLSRTPLNSEATLWINPDITTLADIEVMTGDDVRIENYVGLEPIKYPFTV